jgi:hypothetical protein
MEYLEVIIKGILCGILSAFLVIYGLRPAIPYPDFLLEFFENPWLFLILLIVTYYIFIWDHMLGALLLLSIAALIFDYIVFTNKGYKKVILTEQFEHLTNPIFETINEPVKTSYNVIIDDIKASSILEVYPGDPAPWHP